MSNGLLDFVHNLIPKDKVKNEIVDSLKKIIDKETVFIGIGCTYCSGDSFGPKVTSILKQYGLNVYGHNDHNLNDFDIMRIPTKFKDSNILAIDSSISADLPIDKVIVENCPCNPGGGIGKNLPSIGNNSLSYISLRYWGQDADTIVNQLYEYPIDIMDKKVQFAAECILEAVGMK